MRTLLCVLSVSCLFAGEWSKSYTVGASPDVEIRCDDASLEVTGGGSGKVSARVVTRGWEIKAGEVEVVESQSGDRVSLHVRVPRGMFFNWGGDRSIKVYLTVPSQLRLRAETGDGSIRAGQIQGDLRLTTGDGSIGGNALAGLLEARTGDGSITITGRFDGLRLHTGDGSISATAAPGSVVKTAWSVETGDGSVRVTVPSDLKADFEARTGDGGVRVDLPGVRSNGQGSNSMSGRMNGGGLPFRVRTGDGSVTVAAR